MNFGIEIMDQTYLFHRSLEEEEHNIHSDQNGSKSKF